MILTLYQYKYAKCQAHTHLDHQANQNLIYDSDAMDLSHNICVNIKQFNSIYQTSPGLHHIKCNDR